MPVKIERHYDAIRINEIINTPDIYEWTHGSIVGPMDLSDLLRDLKHICLIGEQGGILFVWLQPGLYEVHVSILEPGRGRWAVEFVREALRYMFTQTDALELFSKVPYGNIRAKALVRAIGGKFEFTRPNSWVKDHRPIPSDIYSLKVQDWVRDAEGLVEKGEWFHQELSNKYLELGRLDAQHDEDSNHDRYVGATIEMIQGGQPYKAAVLYNRWANISGYESISVISIDPVIINIQESILLVQGSDFKVITCQSALQ